VICADAGAFGETVEHGETGVRCHTLQDYCVGVQMALDGAFDRERIRRRAVARYDMKRVAERYAYAFRTILDLYRPGGGWYGDTSFLAETVSKSSDENSSDEKKSSDENSSDEKKSSDENSSESVIQ